MNAPGKLCRACGIRVLGQHSREVEDWADQHTVKVECSKCGIDFCPRQEVTVPFDGCRANTAWLDDIDEELSNPVA